MQEQSSWSYGLAFWLRVGLQTIKKQIQFKNTESLMPTYAVTTLDNNDEIITMMGEGRVQARLDWVIQARSLGEGRFRL